MPKIVWTAENIARLIGIRHNTPEVSLVEIAKIFGTTRGAIRTKLNKLGCVIREHWSDEELKILIEYYGKVPINKGIDLTELVRRLHPKLKSNIVRKASTLGLTNKARPAASTSKSIGSKPHFFSKFRHVKSGKREDLPGQLFVRSGWEANYARYLEYQKKLGLISEWHYEPDTFLFHKISRGIRSYLPDFKVVYPNGKHEYHEVKGWMTPASKTKLNRMAKYYPEEKVVVIDGRWFKAAKVDGLDKLIPGWE